MPIKLTEEQAWALLTYYMVLRAFQIWVEMEL